MSTSLDPDQARQFIGPDLGPNCSQKLSANGTSWQRVNILWQFENIDKLLGPVEKNVSGVLLNVLCLLLLSNLCQTQYGSGNKVLTSTGKLEKNREEKDNLGWCIYKSFV